MVPFRAHLDRAARRIRGLALVLAGTLVPLITPQATPPADSDDVLSRWIARQSAVHAWSADFIQTRKLKTLIQPLTTPGRVWFAEPNRFRWELGQPAQTIAVRQPDSVLVLYPKLERAERYLLTNAAAGPWSHMLTLLEAGFPRSRADLDRQFQLTSQSVSNDLVQLMLEPRAAAARRLMPRFLVTLSSPSLDLRATELVFADGSSLRNEFTQTAVNPPIDDTLFSPVLAPGVRIVEPLARSRR